MSNPSHDFFFLLGSYFWKQFSSIFYMNLIFLISNSFFNQAYIIFQFDFSRKFLETVLEIMIIYLLILCNV